MAELPARPAVLQMVILHTMLVLGKFYHASFTHTKVLEGAAPVFNFAMPVCFRLKHAQKS